MNLAIKVDSKLKTAVANLQKDWNSVAIAYENFAEKKLKSDTLCVICAHIIHEFPKFHKLHEFPSNSHSRPTEKHSQVAHTY